MIRNRKTIAFPFIYVLDIEKKEVKKEKTKVEGCQWTVKREVA